MRRLVVSLALALSLLGLAPRANAALSVYHLYVIWLKGEGEADRKNVDSFIDCLVHKTTYETYWNGDVLIVPAGSYVVPKPSSALGDASNIGPFIDGLISGGAIPKAPSYGTPIYEVMVDPSQTSCALGAGTGGRNSPGTVQGKPAGLIINTTNPAAFWPARDPIGGETQLTEHEVAEVIDGLRGGYQCAGDFCCEGWCNAMASCGNLAGLQCPGAPATTKTGSGACGDVNGWLVQTLSHQGAATCTGPVTCDFSLGFSCTGDENNLHGPCATTADCCSGLTCAQWASSTNQDDPPQNACCKAAGSTCTLGTDCCGGMNCDTASGKCVCVPEGKFCENDSDCCSGDVCTASACLPPPAVDAGAVDAAGGPDGSDAGPVDVPLLDGGCSCQTTGLPGGSSPFALVLLGLGTAVFRRQRR